jgi:hypothetical protein
MRLGQVDVNKGPFGKATQKGAATETYQPPRRRPIFFDARRSGRKRMVIPGKLSLGPAAPPLDCLIGDMSVGGARVRVKPGATVPSELYLVHLKEWFAYEARVVWRRGDGNLGLAFKRSYDLDGAIRADLRTMREFCVAYEDAK